MNNFIEQLEQSKNTTHPNTMLKRGKFSHKVYSTYYNTGKENSKFFPVLNYAAAKIMSVSVFESEECKLEAMKWVNDNISCSIMSYLPVSLANASVFIAKFFENSDDCIKQNLVHTCGKMMFTSHDDLFGRTTVMQPMDSPEGDTHISITICDIINSIAYMASGLFDEHLSKIEAKVNRIPNKAVMLRLLKEQITCGKHDSLLGSQLTSVITDLQNSKSKNTYLFPLKSIDLLEGPSFCVYNSADDECILFKDDSVYNILNASSKELALCDIWVSSANIGEIMGKYNSTYAMLTKNVSTIRQQRDILVEMASEGKKYKQTAAMINYINEFRNRIPLPLLAKEIMFVYSITGKENSKFFPLLNYAAMRILNVEQEHDTSYEKAALECVRDNMRYIVMCRNSNFANGFVAVKIEDVEAVAGGKIILSENISLGFKIPKTREDLMCTPRSVTRNESNIAIPWFYLCLVMTVTYMLSKPLGEALERLKGKMELFPSTKRVMRMMKEYKFSGNNKFRSLRKMIDDLHGSGDIIFPIAMRENYSILDDYYICRFDTANEICWLFNERNIARLSDINEMYATELDGRRSLDIMHRYVDGIDKMKRTICAIESQRKDFLELITVKEH